MIKFPLGTNFLCWNCEDTGEADALLHQPIAEWQCTNCGEKNFVFIDNIRLRIGEKLYRVAKGMIERKDCDLAIIFLISSVDASLGVGIRDLTIWRATENLEAPPDKKTIENKLKKMGYKEKVKEFERLAGITLKDEICRLNREGNIPNEELNGYSKLVDDFKVLSEQRNRLIHLGDEIDNDVIKSKLQTIEKAIFLLATMYHAAFDLERPALKQ